MLSGAVWPAIAAEFNEQMSYASIQMKQMSAQEVHDRWLFLTKQTRKGGGWTSAEDSLLVQAVSFLEDQIEAGHPAARRHERHIQWADIAAILRWRTGKQCRDRWNNQLNPRIDRSPLSQVEVDTIIRLHAEMGNRWRDIAGALPGRTENAVKNCFHSIQRRKARRPDEDRR